MSAHELLNLLNKLGRRQDARLCRASYRFFPNKFNKFNYTGARMQDLSYDIIITYNSQLPH